MSAAVTGALQVGRATRLRRLALGASVTAFALLWAGGVASHWLGGVGDEEGRLASAFLFLAGLVVLLGERTVRGAASLLSVALFGFAVEALGVRLGVPFGAYAYTDALRPQLLGVPVVMGFAWMALVAFACGAASRLRLGAWPSALAAALLTTATDLVIDPLAANQFRYWTWEGGGAYYGIPFSNFAGWFLTALVACLVAGPRRAPNFWAGFVGTAVLLFFALIALAYHLFPVALVGFALYAAGLLLWRERRGPRGRRA